MNWLKSGVAMVLVILWAPATSLCLIERTGWLSNDDCCPSSCPSAPAETSTCCALVSATYKLDDDAARPAVARPILRPAFLDWAAPIPAPAATSIPQSCLSPPELPTTWQFSQRTAWPPRAPSRLS